MKSSFQVILIGVFIAAFIGAILVFAGIIKVGSNLTNNKVTGTVIIWGTYPEPTLQSYFDALNIQNQDITIRYVQQPSPALDSSLVRAIADGIPPDLILVDSEQYLTYANRLYTIPFSTYNERVFRDTFIDGASTFLSAEGVVAVPIVVDPLVVYYNKDLLAGQRYITPPATWDDLVKAVPRFVKKDSRGSITQTALPFGGVNNIIHFKSILATLFLQTGNPIVTKNNTTGVYESRLQNSIQDKDGIPATASALSFYTNFTNPTHPLYSWNTSLPSSLDMFLSGRSAFYIGRASELFNIQARNPNLNFDITTMFQSNNAVRPITHGQFTGIAVVAGTKNFAASYQTLGTLSTKEFADYLSKSFALPPTRRDLLLVQQENPYVQSFFQAAASAFTWTNPSPIQTETVFRDMIRKVQNGESTATQAIYEASRDL